MTDMDRLIEAADALADEADRIAAIVNDDHGHRPVILSNRIATYRAAREAITKGTPPAFATSA